LSGIESPESRNSDPARRPWLQQSPRYALAETFVPAGSGKARGL